MRIAEFLAGLPIVLAGVAIAAIAVPLSCLDGATTASIQPVSPRLPADAATVCDVDRSVTAARLIRTANGTPLVVSCDGGAP